MPNPAWVSGQSITATVATSVGFSNSSNALVSGNCMVLVVASYWDSGIPGQPTVTDNNGHTFTWAAGGAHASLDGCRIDIFFSAPLTTGFSSNTYTATAVAAQSTGFNEIGGVLTEWSGFGALGPAVDQSGFATTAAATSTASVTLSAATSQQAVEAVICALHFNDNTNPDGISTPGGTGTWISSGILTNATIFLAVGSAYQVTSATGTAYTASWSGLDTTTNNGGSAVIVALYPASASDTLASQICM